MKEKMVLLRKFVLLAADIALINVAFLLSLVLRFEGNVPAETWRMYRGNAWWVTAMFVEIGRAHV